MSDPKPILVPDAIFAPWPAGGASAHAAERGMVLLNAAHDFATALTRDRDRLDACDALHDVRVACGLASTGDWIDAFLHHDQVRRGTITQVVAALSAVGHG